jgi:hypothetical protein
MDYAGTKDKAMFKTPSHKVSRMIDALELNTLISISDAHVCSVKTDTYADVIFKRGFELCKKANGRDVFLFESTFHCMSFFFIDTEESLLEKITEVYDAYGDAY